MRLAVIIFILVELGLMFGCGPVNKENDPYKQPPTSSISRSVALEDAKAWVLRDPANRTCSFTSPTGSMLPHIASNSILLFEVLRGQPIHVGDYVRRRSDDVMHKVTAVNKNGSYLADAVNGQTPDGWFPYSEAKYRYVGQYQFDPATK